MHRRERFKTVPYHEKRGWSSVANSGPFFLCLPRPKIDLA
jgi:hypothetical protein